MKNLARSLLNSPKIRKWKKNKKNKHARRGKKQKTWRGCLWQTKRVSKNLLWWMLWYLLFELLSQTPPNAKKMHLKSEKKILQISRLFFWMLRGGQIPDLTVHFHFLWVVLVFKMKDVQGWAAETSLSLQTFIFKSVIAMMGKLIPQIS